MAAVTPEGWKKYRRPPKATIVSAVLLVLFHLVVLVMFTLPDRRLPMLLQRLVAVADAALAASVLVFAVSELWKKHRKVTVFNKFKINTAKVGGSSVFALMLALWFTPLAPIKIGVPAAKDIANWFSNEMMIAALSLSDPYLAVPELPVPPPQARRVAASIPESATPFAQALKAMSQGRYEDARLQLEKAEKSGGAAAQELHLAHGQLEVFAGQVWDAPQWFELAMQDKPDDADAICQAALSHALAGNYSKASELGQSLLDRVRADAAAASRQLPVALNLMSAICICQGRLKEAEAFGEEAGAIWDKAEADKSWPQATGFKAAARNNQAVMYSMYPEKYWGAESQFKAAVDGWRDGYGEQNGPSGDDLVEHGSALSTGARFTDSEAAFDHAMQNAAGTLPPRCVNRGMILMADAHLLESLGQYAEARRLSKESREMLDRRMPPQQAAGQRLRAMLDLDEGRYAMGNKHIGDAARVGHTFLPPEHAFFGAVAMVAAELDVARADFISAEPTCKQAIQIITAKLGENQPAVARVYDTWGIACARQGQKTDGAEIFRASPAR